MPSLNGLVARLRGDRVNELSNEVTALRELALQMNHTVAMMSETLEAVRDTVGGLSDLVHLQHTVITDLNHDVRSGAEGALPLFLGYTERLRLDTDAAIGAAQVIERQLGLLDDLGAEAGRPEPS